MIKRLSLLAFLLTAAFSFAQNRSIEFDHGTFAEILAKAKKEHKMIYIDCYTSWCGPCKWMAKNVFTNDTVADFYNQHFVNAKIDMEKGEGIDIAQKYDIRAYPTMLYLDENGVQLHRTCGSCPSANFVAGGKDALSPNTQLATYSANFSKGKSDATSAFHYFSMLENGCQSYGKEVSDYFASVKTEELRSRGNWNIIYKYVEDYDSPVFKAFEADRASFAKTYNLDSVEQKINRVYITGLYSSIQNKDMQGYELLKQKLRASGTRDAEMIILQSDIKLYQRNGDWARYAALSSDYIEKYSMNDASDLNTFAWSFYEHVDDKAMLQKAEQWAKKATELDDNYPYNDTYAAVLFKLGKKADAKAAAQKAIGIAKKTGDDYKETAELLDRIEALK
jgi:thiol-disulfide isomerase/thioredoxin